MQPDEWQSIFSELAGSVSGGCFTNNLRAFQNNLAKIHNTGNHIYVENLKKKLCTCAQSHSSGTRTQFQLEILIRTTISAIHKFQENIFESSRNVSETTPRLSCPSCPLMHGHSQSWVNSQEVQGLLINSLTIDRCIKNCHHILLVFCEIALGWMSTIWMQYWKWLGTDRERFKYSMEYFRWIPTKLSRLNKMYQTPVKRSSWLGYFISPQCRIYMRRWIWSALIRVMVSRLFGVKPLPEPVLSYNQLDLWEQTSVKLQLKFKHLHWR